MIYACSSHSYWAIGLNPKSFWSIIIILPYFPCKKCNFGVSNLPFSYTIPIYRRPSLFSKRRRRVHTPGSVTWAAPNNTGPLIKTQSPSKLVHNLVCKQQGRDLFAERSHVQNSSWDKFIRPWRCLSPEPPGILYLRGQAFLMDTGVIIKLSSMVWLSDSPCLLVRSQIPIDGCIIPMDEGIFCRNEQPNLLSVNPRLSYSKWNQANE